MGWLGRVRWSSWRGSLTAITWLIIAFQRLRSSAVRTHCDVVRFVATAWYCPWFASSSFLPSSYPYTTVLVSWQPWSPQFWQNLSRQLKVENYAQVARVHVELKLFDASVASQNRHLLTPLTAAHYIDHHPQPTSSNMDHWPEYGYYTLSLQ